MFNCFYSLSRFCSDVCDLLICTFDAYFIKLFRLRKYSYKNWNTDDLLERRNVPSTAPINCWRARTLIDPVPWHSIPVSASYRRIPGMSPTVMWPVSVKLYMRDRDGGKKTKTTCLFVFLSLGWSMTLSGRRWQMATAMDHILHYNDLSVCVVLYK